VATLRRAIHAGAAGFFLWPAEREELAVAAARVRMPDHAEPVGRASVVAVYGARGGTGATFVATHLCAALARLRHRAVLVDMDVVFAGASAAVGVLPADGHRTIADLVPLGEEIAPRHVEDVVWRHPEGFGVLLAPGDERAAASIRGSNYRSAVDAARRTCDVVVLHVPRGLDEVVRTGLELADRILVVLGLDVASFRDGRRAVDAVGRGDRCAFVVNRATRSEISPKDVERVFGTPAIAVIPSDRAVGAAQDRGRLVPLRGRTGRALTRLARRVLEDA
jgi:pilus assembly protein CpaE